MSQVYLVALQKQGQHDWEVEDNLTELGELATDAGLIVAGEIIQRKSRPEPATFIGLGKVMEISTMLSENDIVLFDDELTPAQLGNLSELLDAPVLDRTQLILDIFAQRARTKEGKIQVELAQLNYLLPRLIGHGRTMSRLGAGIGTRGPGETKLETDRRRIRKRISDLENELATVKRVRVTHRQNRRRSRIPLVAIVGYTNAGKSSLLSTLTSESTYIAGKLFATLDPIVRRWDLTEQFSVYLSDTVGFIRKLPHTLVAAFQATLEELLEADLILHVIDASNPQMEEQEKAVLNVSEEIGVSQDIISVYNKMDKVKGDFFIGQNDVAVSALTGENLDELTIKVYDYFSTRYSTRQYFIPFEQLTNANFIHQNGEVLTEKYNNRGVFITAKVDKYLANKLEPWES